ncbi:ankyrin repeat domain-containing protein [Sphingomonas alba]|uniref:Ankyrin repeat domain-containing protein n=1 Tax=Sphingomonas alba TaxID=2908208 RepID=A0ABT0RMH6_9SPHN|nr:ankyrin repeat domain-containing protein [Sphingomonas alba]MCL6683843.1 ankyrin repeat domain-containing protein [Sphingomonas alba]
MHRLVRSFVIAGALLASAPTAAQYGGSDGEAFVKAMHDGDGGKALELINKPGSTVVNYRGGDGDAALHIAMHNRNPNWVGFLLSKDADPDIGDKNGDTPLIIAARIGFTEGAARMLMKHAQVDKTNKLGETALIVAVQARQSPIVKMLLEAGADPDLADHASGYTAREYAKRDNRSKDIVTLIETVKSAKKATVGPVRP